MMNLRIGVYGRAGGGYAASAREITVARGLAWLEWRGHRYPARSVEVRAGGGYLLPRLRGAPGLFADLDPHDYAEGSTPALIELIALPVFVLVGHDGEPLVDTPVTVEEFPP